MLCLIPDVKQLLIFTYENVWLLCEEASKFPDSETGGQRTTTAQMTGLMTQPKKATVACVRNCNDFLQVIQCVQEVQESLPAFILH